MKTKEITAKHIHHYGTETPVCPWCGYIHDWDDDFNEIDAMECESCGRPFELDIEMSPSCDTQKLWSTEHAPYGYIAQGIFVGRVTHICPDEFKHIVWLKFARSHWTAEFSLDGAFYAFGGRFQGTVFPWEER